jgi:ferredoxin-thioredoxin reductase catalytic chain
LIGAASFTGFLGVFAKRRRQRETGERRRVEREMMGKFVEVYAKKTGTRMAKNREVTDRVIEGLVENKIKYGTPLCPCRTYEDAEYESKRAYWNCPCEPMRKERKCHCMLFLEAGHPMACQEEW